MMCVCFVTCVRVVMCFCFVTCVRVVQALVAQILKTHTHKVVLAIGDGGNDVPMIKMANIGVRNTLIRVGVRVGVRLGDACHSSE